MERGLVGAVGGNSEMTDDASRPAAPASAEPRKPLTPAAKRALADSIDKHVIPQTKSRAVSAAFRIPRFRAWPFGPPRNDEGHISARPLPSCRPRHAGKGR